MSSLIFKTKRIFWFNPVFLRPASSKILIQNENGPCALIALVNTLILNYQLKNNYDPSAVYLEEVPQYSGEIEQLIKLVDTKDRVQLAEVIDVLASILLAQKLEEGQASAVLDLLPLLHEGLNINPNFLSGKIDNSVQEALFLLNEVLNDFKPEETEKHASVLLTKVNPEVSLFGAYGVSVLHGWVIDPIADLEEYATISHLKNFESCQNFLIYVDELLEGKSNNSVGKEKLAAEPQSDSMASGHAKSSTDQLTEPQLETLREYSGVVNSWLGKSVTQLTAAGLENLKAMIEPNSFTILFRNDHFSTLIKRTVFNQNNEQLFELYALVTDLGFLSQRKIVWQGISVDGEDGFYDENFIPVEIATSSSNQVPSKHSDFAKDVYQSNEIYSGAGDLYEDGEDYNLAKELQEKEDAFVAKKLQMNYEKKSSKHAKAKAKEPEKKVKSNLPPKSKKECTIQ